MNNFKKMMREQPDKYIELISILLDDYLGNIIIFDIQDNIIFASNSVCRDLGCTQAEVVGAHKNILIEKGYTERSASDIAIKSREPVFVSVKALKTNNVMFASSTPIYAKDGNIQFVINRSEAETDLLNKINTIYEERFRIDNQNKNHFDFADRYLLSTPSQIIAKSPSIRHTFNQATRIAKTDSFVMLNGEPGVGKEVFARYIHQNSLRANAPFIPVNCAAIPKELIESEFFGYDKGAFTGASLTGKPGLFELANNGTLFLDEIGELPLSLQPKLLRALDSGEIKRVGGQKITKANVRIIAATNKDLFKMVKQDYFREDLYYRLSVIPLKIPPLRERLEDICELAYQFLRVYNEKYGTKKKFAMQTIDLFNQYTWPGNVRELKNVIERLATLSQTEVIYLDKPLDETASTPYYKPAAGAEEKPQAGNNIPIRPFYDAVQEFEKNYITRALELCEGNVSKTAKVLNMHRSVIYKKLR